MNEAPGATFDRLNVWDAVAMLAAVALLFVMALDWYSTELGEEARRIEGLTSDPASGIGGEVERQLNPRASEAAEEEESNAWQPSVSFDWLVLVGLLVTAALALGAAFLRALGRRFEPPWTPSAFAALAAAATGVLVAVRTLAEPGVEAGATVKAGAPLGLLVLGVIAYACSRAMRLEEAGEAFREVPAGSSDRARRA